MSFCPQLERMLQNSLQEHYKTTGMNVNIKSTTNIKWCQLAIIATDVV